MGGEAGFTWLCLSLLLLACFKLRDQEVGIWGGLPTHLLSYGNKLNALITAAAISPPMAKISHSPLVAFLIVNLMLYLLKGILLLPRRKAMRIRSEFARSPDPRGGA